MTATPQQAKPVILTNTIKLPVGSMPA